MTCPAAISCAARIFPGYEWDGSRTTMATTLHNWNLPVLCRVPQGIPMASHAREATHLQPGTSGTLGDDFATTLLAMVGHDLGQPLQIITSAQSPALCRATRFY
jgi:hypothetical protein